MLPRRIITWACLWLMMLPALVSAQPSPAPSAHAGESLSVSLLTIGPGPAAYELFGHNAILIRDQRTGRGWAFNYGVFDFDQENFYGRFIQGRLLYRMEAFDADAMIEVYRRQDRSMWVQDLAFSPAQRLALFEYLRNWVGREYLYDYYLNNCSTQVRDALDAPHVLGGAIRAATEDTLTRNSFRSHTRRLTSPHLPLYLALEVVLGTPIDQPISRWREMFLPEELRQVVNNLQVTDERGQTHLLVSAQRQIHHSTRFHAPPRPPVLVGGFLALGLAIAVALLALSRRGDTRRWARRTFSAIVAIWCLVLGLAGAISLWGWFFTDHWATRWNQNVLLANLLALPLVGLIFCLKRPWARRPTVWLANVLAGMALVAAALALATRGLQYNFDVLALTLPVWLALALTIRRHVATVGRAPGDPPKEKGPA